jgi:hypothetical protein
MVSFPAELQMLVYTPHFRGCFFSLGVEGVRQHHQPEKTQLTHILAKLFFSSSLEHKRLALWPLPLPLALPHPQKLQTPS